MSSENNDWKSKDPYRTRGKDEKFDAKWTGRCFCGNIKYQLSRDKPLDVKYCHCRDCQRMHSAPFQWAAIFEKSDINFLTGAKGLTWWDSSAKVEEHNLPCKVVCDNCHAAIMDEGRKMILIYPTLLDNIVSPEGRDVFKVKQHIFYKSRVVDFKGDGAVKWAGLDGKSEKVDDDGNSVDRGEKQGPGGPTASV
ncbi:hypothetical protein NKR23_g10730 [Pleurostoma richardsiae]|uniref:CENP-V/GFA domain-containing protein n=1 Tax=Pleurostoma richardsiae TaxID=41990 RepID=A0AA38VI20_9PEZI|nr:hypothetical protein NKR23_g10730 [Pleurostoma richardsiae]